MVSYEFHVCKKDSQKILEYITNREDIPNWLYKLSNRQFKIFFDTVINANGTKYNRWENDETSILYGTEKFLKNIQGLIVTKGYASTFTIDNRGDPRLNICAKTTIEYDAKASTHKEFYNGIVWCIETPLTNFMVRYKGTCYFTGNSWAFNWMTTGQELPVWVHQGGYATLRSYDFDNKNVPESHVKTIETSKIYHIDSQNNFYCHGGFNPKVPIEQQTPDFILWDRTLCKYAHNRWLQKNPAIIEPYNRIFLGHTSTMFFHSTRPLIMGNVVMMDTGGGDIGKLTIMNVDTLEWWQSEKKTKVDTFTYGGSVVKSGN
jgi:serine/threonine protein phosphatase 1